MEKDTNTCLYVPKNLKSTKLIYSNKTENTTHNTQ